MYYIYICIIWCGSVCEWVGVSVGVGSGLLLTVGSGDLAQPLSLCASAFIPSHLILPILFSLNVNNLILQSGYNMPGMVFFVLLFLDL